MGNYIDAMSENRYNIVIDTASKCDYEKCIRRGKRCQKDQKN